MINLDGAFNHRTGAGGWGAIGRNHESTPVFAAAGVVEGASEALQTEAEALIQSIRASDSMGIGRPIFATDCMGLIQSINNTGYDLSPLGALFREAKSLLALGFIEHRIMYMPRECNKPAHVLAGFGASRSQGSAMFWGDELPDFEISAMYGDSAEQS